MVSVSVDKAQLLILLDRLAGLIDDDLGSAEEVINELNQLTGDSEWSEWSGKISAGLDEFDIDAAREDIEKFRKKLTPTSSRTNTTRFFGRDSPGIHKNIHILEEYLN